MISGLQETMFWQLNKYSAQATGIKKFHKLSNPCVNTLAIKDILQIIWVNVSV